jgi:hypothetical protein
MLSAALAISLQGGIAGPPPGLGRAAAGAISGTAGGDSPPGTRAPSCTLRISDSEQWLFQVSLRFHLLGASVFQSSCILDVYRRLGK